MRFTLNGSAPSNAPAPGNPDPFDPSAGSESESFARSDRPPPQQPTAPLAQMKRASTTDLLAQTCNAVAAMDLAQMKRASTTDLLAQTIDATRV